MARPTKLDKKLQNRIVKLIRSGVSIADTCAAVGIAESTYYDWMAQGAAGDDPYSEFSEAVNRARNHAKVTAIGTIHTAAQPYTQRSKTVKTYTETRLRKAVDETTGKPIEVPYEHREVSESVTVTYMQGDWRAAVEYLKRRYPDEWTDRLHLDDWRTDAIAAIKRGEITYDALEELFDTSLAAELFAAAGVPIQAREGETS